MIDLHLQVRPAAREDYQALSSLIFFETHAHRHLDWRMPLDWLGSPYFWVLEDDRRALAALACPPDPPGVAWIRLFVHSGAAPPGWAWPALWESARRDMAALGGAQVAAIVRQDWFRRVLLESGFQPMQPIVMLEWRGRPVMPPALAPGFRLRPMTSADLPEAARVDAESFGPFWMNSLDALTRAFSMRTSAALAEDPQGRVAAYQISTANASGAHLARLGVRKEAQGRGLGRALVADLIRQMRGRNVERLTVNTQADNAASLALYQGLGFVRTGEEFPVVRFDVGGSYAS
ncbi:MAG: GNAT family N-acetyltransferase [Chloroflexota bacterium]